MYASLSEDRVLDEEDEEGKVLSRRPQGSTSPLVVKGRGKAVGLKAFKVLVTSCCTVLLTSCCDVGKEESVCMEQQRYRAGVGGGRGASECASTLCFLSTNDNEESMKDTKC